MQNRVGSVKRETSLQHVKREEEARGVVKCERVADGETNLGSDDVIVLETRSCKRYRLEGEVVVLD